MVDFRGNQHTKGKQRPRNYLARREQRRMLLLVMMLGLVLVMMSEAADPENWAWFWQMGGQGGVARQDTAAPQPRRYDTRVRPDSPAELPLDTFIMPLKAAQVDPSADYFEGVAPEHLKKIKDHTEFRARERDAWFNLLEVLERATPEALDQAEPAEVGFVQLFEQPDEYRGRLVKVRGTMKRSFDVGAQKNEFGITTYFQNWLYPAGGPVSPIVIYSLNVPEGFPSSRLPDGGFRNIHEEVEVVGFFYKNWAYKAGTSQILSAPLIVAKTIRWKPKTQAQSAGAPVEEPISLVTVALTFVAAAIIGVLVASYIFLTSKEGSQPAVGALAARFQSESLSALQDEDLGPDVGEVLKQIAEQEQSASEPDPDSEQPGKRNED